MPMREFFPALVCAVVLLATGCSSPVVTLHPLYTHDQIVQDDVVCATWNGQFWQNPPVLSFEKKDASTYSAVIRHGDIVLRPARVRLVRLGHHLFADANIPNPDPKDGDSQIHVIARIGLLGNKLFVRWLEHKSVTELLEKAPTELSHRIEEAELSPYNEWLLRDYMEKQMRELVKQRAGDLDRDAEEKAIKEALRGLAGPQDSEKKPPIVITADTPEIQAFVRRVIGRSDLWGSVMIFEADREIPVAEKGLASKADRTFNYWFEVWQRCAAWSDDIPITSTNRVSIDPEHWERLADAINDLPTQSVDMDAVKCARSIASLSAETADVLRRSTFKAWMGEAIGRSLAGDPVGAVGDRIGAVAQREHDVATKIRLCRDQIEDARVLLTDRYGIEFPRMR